MTDLKPCPFCGSAPHWHDSTTVRCPACCTIGPANNWNTRAVPELPEGYREDDEGDLCCGVSILAFDYGHGSVAVGSDESVILSKSDAQALAIWLQRRLHADT